MNWRPWVVVATLFLAFVMNVTMFATEDMKPPAKNNDPSVIPSDRILTDMIFVPENRRDNFKMMGMSDDMADKAVAMSKREYKERKEMLQSVLKTQEDLLGRIFCKSADPPTRYAALSVLVVPDGGGRRALQASEIAELAGQDWYAQAPVRDVYVQLELADDGDYNVDATVMGVSALILGEQDKVINREYPWGKANSLTNGWSFSGVQSKYQSKKINDTLIDYFAVMEIMTEIARQENGICR